MVRISLSAMGEQRMRDLNRTLNGLSERVMERIPVSEHEGVERSLTLLLAALQAEVEDPSLPADTPAGKEESDGGAAGCTCD
jgi:hypothetical protein